MIWKSSTVRVARSLNLHYHLLHCEKYTSWSSKFKFQLCSNAVRCVLFKLCTSTVNVVCIHFSVVTYLQLFALEKNFN